MDIIDNKCNNCGGELTYDPDSCELKCLQCSTITDIPEQNTEVIKKPYDQNSTIEMSKTQYTQYSCNTCGRKHISPINKEISFCPSCGDGNLEKTVGVEYMPDGIIPFKLNKEKALVCFKDWLKKRIFAPNNLKRLAKTQTLTGIYLPIYNYDMDTYTTYSGVGIREHKDKDGRLHTSRQTFNSSRSDKFKNYIESANTNISSNLLRDMANYDYNKIYAYRTEFLYGWLGSDININLHDSCTRAKNNISSEVRTRVRNSLHYDRIKNFTCTTNFKGIWYNYLYVPLWVNTYKYKDKHYNCYINGITGKVSGKSPKSFWKIFFTVLGVIAIMAGFFAIFYSCNMINYKQHINF